MDEKYQGVSEAVEAASCQEITRGNFSKINCGLCASFYAFTQLSSSELVLCRLILIKYANSCMSLQAT